VAALTIREDSPPGEGASKSTKISKELASTERHEQL
jgi:hypothetical protein